MRAPGADVSARFETTPNVLDRSSQDVDSAELVDHAFERRLFFCLPAATGFGFDREENTSILAIARARNLHYSDEIGRALRGQPNDAIAVERLRSSGVDAEQSDAGRAANLQEQLIHQGVFADHSSLWCPLAAGAVSAGSAAGPDRSGA